MAFDQRVFVSFNPFNVYVAQADVKPACVLRPANVVPILRDKGLINDSEVRSCKANMNTWAFVWDLKNTPQLSCVYKSEDAQNEFLSDPRYGIGEDYLDDDRAKMQSMGKNVKGKMTEGQKDLLQKTIKLDWSKAANEQNKEILSKMERNDQIHTQQRLSGCTKTISYSVGKSLRA